MKYCFVTDKDSDYFKHSGEDYPSWYLIPADKRTKFFGLLTGYALNVMTREEMKLALDKYKIDDIENYSFENPEEI